MIETLRRAEIAQRRHTLRDDQWERIKDLLPGRPGHVGVTARDNRFFVGVDPTVTLVAN